MLRFTILAAVMRIECFHYLGQEERGADSAAGEQAGGAAQLAHALLAFHEHAANVLAPHRLAEIITSVREKGAQFTELEYLNAFKVIETRRGISPADMKISVASALLSKVT